MNESRLSTMFFACMVHHFDGGTIATSKWLSSKRKVRSCASITGFEQAVNIVKLSRVAKHLNVHMPNLESWVLSPNSFADLPTFYFRPFC